MISYFAPSIDTQSGAVVVVMGVVLRAVLCAKLLVVGMGAVPRLEADDGR